MDNFAHYLKKQLLEYVEAERRKGVPLDQIEHALLNAGHDKNLIDEVMAEYTQPMQHEDPVEEDMVSMLKKGIQDFMAKLNTKEISAVKKDFKETDTDKVVKEVVREAEVIEEKTMLEGAFFFGYMIVFGIIAFITAAATDAGLFEVFLGFLPTIINAFASFAMLPLADNVPLYAAIPLLISSAFYGIGKFSGLPFFNDMDIESLAIVNFLFSFIFNVLIVYVRFMKPKHMKKRVKKIVHKHVQETPVVKKTVVNPVVKTVVKTPEKPIVYEPKRRKEIEDLRRL